MIFVTFSKRRIRCNGLNRIIIEVKHQKKDSYSTPRIILNVERIYGNCENLE